MFHLLKSVNARVQPCLATNIEKSGPPRGSTSLLGFQYVAILAACIACIQLVKVKRFVSFPHSEFFLVLEIDINDSMQKYDCMIYFWLY